MSLVLSKFGIILSAIIALYSQPTAQVYTWRLLSKPFTISNGTIFNLVIEPLAEAIRSHTLISGFQSCQHVNNVCTDDVILILKNPTISFQHAHQVLSLFSDIFYYRVNFLKTLILDLGLNMATKHILQKKLPYKWSPQGIPYLGITITAKMSSLVAFQSEPFY